MFTEGDHYTSWLEKSLKLQAGSLLRKPRKTIFDIIARDSAIGVLGNIELAYPLNTREIMEDLSVSAEVKAFLSAAWRSGSLRAIRSDVTDPSQQPKDTELRIAKMLIAEKDPNYVVKFNFQPLEYFGGLQIDIEPEKVRFSETIKGERQPTAPITKFSSDLQKLNAAPYTAAEMTMKIIREVVRPRVLLRDP